MVLTLNNKVHITNLKTNDIKILSKEKCNELLNLYKNGDKSSKDKIILGKKKKKNTVIKKLSACSKLL